MLVVKELVLEIVCFQLLGVRILAVVFPLTAKGSGGISIFPRRRVAQGESASLTRKRSLVQIQSRLPFTSEKDRPYKLLYGRSFFVGSEAINWVQSFRVPKQGVMGISRPTSAGRLCRWKDHRRRSTGKRLLLKVVNAVKNWMGPLFKPSQTRKCVLAILLRWAI